jgi:hypothetical protein
MRRSPDGWSRDIPAKGELVILAGGPATLDGSWWWRVEWERHQQACRDVHRDWRTTAPNPVLLYRPTQRWVSHPVEVQPGTTKPVEGRVWERVL